MTLKVQCLIVLICSSLLAACATSTAQKKVDFSYTISAAKDINPDINGDPSSVVVQVFQLTNADNFNAALYEDLFSANTSVLGSEVVGVSKHLIDPGSQQTFKTEIPANTKFIGVAVGYRKIDLVNWKTIHLIAEKSLLDSINVFSDKGILISIEPRNVRVSTD